MAFKEEEKEQNN